MIIRVLRDCLAMADADGCSAAQMAQEKSQSPVTVFDLGDTTASATIRVTTKCGDSSDGQKTLQATATLQQPNEHHDDRHDATSTYGDPGIDVD